jgi:EpsI family protein
MKRQDGITALLLVAFVAVGIGAWALALRPPLQVDAEGLAEIPLDLDGWTGRDVALETAVESMLRADFNIQRLYVDRYGDHVWLYVGYYGTDRGGRPEHTPAVCYEAQGWRIGARRRLDVAGAEGLRVNEYRVEQGGERQLVHFWFRSFRSTGLLGVLDQTIDRVVGRLRTGRADGALVRISTGLGAADEVDARSRLLRFAAEFDLQLAHHWPIETPARHTRAVGAGNSPRPVRSTDR